jgi:hypothetical protein
MTLQLGSIDHFRVAQQNQIAWQQNGQNQIDAQRDAAEEFRVFVKRLQGGSHTLNQAFQSFRRKRAKASSSTGGNGNSARGGGPKSPGISLRDFKSVLLAAHVPLSDAQMGQVFAVLDKDSSGDITLDEMVLFCEGKQEGSLELFGDWQKQNGLERAALKEAAARKLHQVDSADALTEILKKHFAQQTNAVSRVALHFAAWRGVACTRACIRTRALLL